MQTRSGFLYSHSQLDIFDIKVEETANLTERLDERALAYAQSIAKDEKKMAKIFKMSGKKDAEKFALETFGKFKNARVEATVTYKASAKDAEFYGEPLPSRLWANNPQSTQSTWRPLRAMLIGGHTWDIDQKSAWMRGLLYICKQLEKKVWNGPNGETRVVMPHVELEDWIENKNDHFRQWSREKNVTTRDMKDKLAAMANYAGSFKTGYEPFKRLTNEIHLIEKKLRTIPEFKRFVEYCDKKKEKTAKVQTMVGVLTRAIETNLTWACVREIEANNLSVCAVIHDGMNVYKHDEWTTDDLVALCNEVCECVTKCDIFKWSYKEPDYSMYDEKGNPIGEFRVPDDFVVHAVSADSPKCPCGCGHTNDEITAGGLELIPVEKTYAYLKKEFEKKHCQIHSQYIDEERRAPEACICTEHEIKGKMHGRVKFYKHIHGKDESFVKKTNFFPEWNDDEDKRYYRDAEMYPDVHKCPDDVYNLWQGYAFQRKRRELTRRMFTRDTVRGVAFYMRHLHRLIDDEFRDFFWEWIAHMLKYPGVKPGILIGLIGQKRIGKGQLIDMIQNLIGMRYYCMTSHPGRDVWGANGTDYCASKILCRLSEPKDTEYRNDPSAMRVWITDNPVECKAMHRKAETVPNYTRFIHDGNEPVLPDEENGGRIAQTLCNSYWKDKWVDDPQRFVEYNTSLGQYIENESVQVALAFMILRVECPKRFSFHRINEVTGSFAAEERKRNRTLIEKFIIHIIESYAWDQTMVELTETGEEGSTRTIEYEAENFSRLQSFKEPLKARAITTMLGNWMAMKHGGIKKERPWNEKMGRMGITVYRFDLVFLREKFSMHRAREQAIRDAALRKERDEHERFPLRRFAAKTCEEKAGCSCGECHLSDEDLLAKYEDHVYGFLNDEFDAWLDTGREPLTYDQFHSQHAALVIQVYWRKHHARRVRTGELERAARAEERKKQEEEQWMQRHRAFEQRQKEDEERARDAHESKVKKELAEMLAIPADPDSVCLTVRRFGGKMCASANACGKCYCDQHGASCACIQCDLKRHFDA
jgi:hypothetical protein